MREADDELSSIRRSGSYRVAVMGLRMMCLAIALVIIAVAVSFVDPPKLFVKLLIFSIFMLGMVGLALVWVGTIPLTAKTSRYVGASPAGLNLQRGVGLVRSILQDAINLRFW